MGATTNILQQKNLHVCSPLQILPKVTRSTILAQNQFQTLHHLVALQIPYAVQNSDKYTGLLDQQQVVYFINNFIEQYMQRHTILYSFNFNVQYNFIIPASPLQSITCHLLYSMTIRLGRGGVRSRIESSEYNLI